MRSYETARSLFSFLAFIAWSTVTIGVLVALISAEGVSRYAGDGAGLLAMVPGIGFGITGLVLVAFVQMGRANVDIAEYSQQMLKISRDHLDVSKQALKLQNASQQSFATHARKEGGQETKRSFSAQLQTVSPPYDTSTNRELEASPVEDSIYHGRTIRVDDGKYSFQGEQFDTLEAAKVYIDTFGNVSARKLSDATRET